MAQTATAVRVAAVSTYRSYLPKRLTDDEQWAAWGGDVKAIQNHVTDAFRHRKIFRDTTEILRQHPTLSNDADAAYWHAWLRNLYAHYITMAVRRELDRGADAPNLYRLLTEIKRRPAVISRVRYRRHYDDSAIPEEFRDQMANTAFKNMAGEGHFIDQKIIRADLKLLDKTSREAIQYANKIVAHRTDEEVRTTMEQVNQALEQIEEILQKYYGLLTGSSLVGAEPSIINTWERAFTVPWITDDGEDEQ